MSGRVLITAGGAGIGRAMAEGFAAAGWQVWVTDVDAAALATCPPAWRRSTVNVTDEAAMQALYADLTAEWGGLDALCANAGIAGPTALIEDVTLEDWRACVSVNLEGAFLAAKYAAPLMKAQRSGSMCCHTRVPPPATRDGATATRAERSASASTAASTRCRSSRGC